MAASIKLNRNKIMAFRMKGSKCLFLFRKKEKGGLKIAIVSELLEKRNGG